MKRTELEPQDEVFFFSQEGTPFRAWNAITRLICPDFEVYRGIVIAVGIHSKERVDELINSGADDVQLWATTTVLLSEVLGAADDDEVQEVANLIARSWTLHLRSQHPELNQRAVILTDAPGEVLIVIQ